MSLEATEFHQKLEVGEGVMLAIKSENICDFHMYATRLMLSRPTHSRKDKRTVCVLCIAKDSCTQDTKNAQRFKRKSGLGFF